MHVHPPTTPLDISDVQLVLTELAVNAEICNHELAQTWAAEQMRGNFAAVPGDYEQFLAQYLASKVAESIEKNIWQGNFAFDAGTAANNLYDGILAKYMVVLRRRIKSKSVVLSPPSLLLQERIVLLASCWATWLLLHLRLSWETLTRRST